MSVLKASSALMRARALYCNVFGHVPLSECLFRAFKAVSSDCSIILSSDSVYCSSVFGSDFFSGPVVDIFCQRWFRVCSPSCLSSF